MSKQPQTLMSNTKPSSQVLVHSSAEMVFKPPSKNRKKIKTNFYYERIMRKFIFTYDKNSHKSKDENNYSACHNESWKATDDQFFK